MCAFLSEIHERQGLYRLDFKLWDQRRLGTFLLKQTSKSIVFYGIVLALTLHKEANQSRACTHQSPKSLPPTKSSSLRGFGSENAQAMSMIAAQMTNII